MNKSVTTNRPIIPSVNYHLWEPCNMHCKFCFATFQDVKQTVLPKGHLSKEGCLEVVFQLAQAGFEKITFAGGEPTLCPWLPEMMQLAKENGMTTMLVTNGTFLTEEYLGRINTFLDWVALSIDSLDPATREEIGRVAKRNGDSGTQWMYDTIARIKQVGTRFKLNTVVCAANWEEDLAGFVKEVRPERWKVMQVLPNDGQNSGTVEPLLISKAQFEEFVDRHQYVTKAGIPFIPECNEAMTNSYAMVDPAGRFFDNGNGYLWYSEPILSVGVHSAMKQVSIDQERFLSRGGEYHW